MCGGGCWVRKGKGLVGRIVRGQVEKEGGCNGVIGELGMKAMKANVEGGGCWEEDIIEGRKG